MELMSSERLRETIYPLKIHLDKVFQLINKMSVSYHGRGVESADRRGRGSHRGGINFGVRRVSVLVFL